MLPLSSNPPDPDTFKVSIPTEIWIRILTHLRNPVPPPLSRPSSRSAIHQHDLTVAARVCRLFNSISKPLLYKVVMIDRLVNFTADARSPERLKLLSLTEALYIEYSEEPSESISYDTILQYGFHFLWSYVGAATAQEKRAATLGEIQAQVKTMELALDELCEGEEGMKDVFPRLTTVAVCSILGRSKRWTVLLRDQHQLLSPKSDRIDIHASAFIWARLLAKSHVKHYCVRDGTHPLSLPQVTSLSLKADLGGPHKTIHYGTVNDGFGVQYGRNIRWVSDTPLDEPWQPPFHDYAFCLDRLVKTMADATPQHLENFLALELDIYSSTGQLGRFPSQSSSPYPESKKLQSLAAKLPGTSTKGPLTVATQRKLAYQLGAYYQTEMRRHSGKKDIIRWHCSGDTPTCMACGSGPPPESSKGANA